VKTISILLILLHLISCSGRSSKSVDRLWHDAEQYRNQENLKDTIASLKLIISKYPTHDLAAQAQFQIADIYLNDVKDFEYAIEEFQKVIRSYPNHDSSKKSLFMIAYIYNNYLNAYSDAIIYYNVFKEKYPNDELFPSVEYELNGLKKFQSIIDSLNTVVNNNPNI